MTEYHLLNLGAGVQSTTLYLMAIAGEIHPLNAPSSLHRRGAGGGLRTPEMAAIASGASSSWYARGPSR